ncbi:histone-lysine N-methyltransferase 2B-like [Oncorhynchus masou masou]|uniref:histone-lysine N-methyltransferase 2B-like n=1 Tax=Oncorhynchus masou masou TaxID=90313 RepID=UPI003183C027
MFNFLASQHRQLPDINPYDEEEDEVPLKSTRRATSLELPMAMRFRHLERTSKEAVGVYRVSAATCSISMTLTWWMPQCAAMRGASSTTCASPTATHASST